jgi:hypothetical protein
VTHSPTPGTALKLAPARRRRWWIAIGLGAVMLALYAAGLAWVTRRLEADMQKSIHPVPAVLEARRGGE